VQHGRRQFLWRAATGSLGLVATAAHPHVGSIFAGALQSEADELKPELIFRARIPRNAEPPLSKLVNSWITPNRLFYVRSHAPNPVIDPDTFRLSVKGHVKRTHEFSLKELEDKFPRVECTCTLTCAGNRRYEHSKVQLVGGVQWEEGPIGNAVWSGYRLSDVLKSLGLQDAAEDVWFDGLDKIRKGDATIPFGGSVPVSKVLQDSKTMPGVLLATHMNGQPLPIDHGFPLRTVVPGFIGARSVKWLGEINVSNRSSPNHYVAHAYKVVESGAAYEWDEAAPIYRFIVNSVICSAGESATPEQMMRIKGYALPTGLPDSTISKVEISTDNGQSWRAAKVDHSDNAYCWSIWSADVPIQSSTSDLLVRASDSTGHNQPAEVSWNPKGYMYNAWHRVPLAKLRASTK
jgi:sulfite oxidase